MYNREKFLSECLQSVLASTLDDFELIVVDDMSTDDSHAVALRAASGDSRVVAVKNERNLGDYGNRSRAAVLARGKYIKYVDSDDLIYRHSLEIMVAAMEAHPAAGLGLCHSEPEVDEPYPWQLLPHDAWFREFLGGGAMGCGPTGAIMNRERFNAAGGFDAVWGVIADTDLWYRMAAQSPLVLLQPGLVWWRRHAGQEFTSSDASFRYLRDRFRLGMKALQSAHCPLNDVERDNAIRRLRQHHARRLISLATRSRQPTQALELFRESGLTAREMAGGLSPYRS